MKKRFEPIEGRNADIIESLTTCREVLSAPDDIQFKVRLCIEEVEENILKYSGSTWVDVWTALEDGFLVIGFQDGGIQFNPLSKPDPDITAPIEERAIGGLGIFLCKKMMDFVDYRFENGCNVFVMKIRIK